MQVGRFSLILLILALVTAGLNISNDGMNQLTGEKRKAVVALKCGQENLCLQWLGQEYTYPRERLNETSDTIIIQLQRVPDYLARIGRISSILIFDPIREKMNGP